MFGFFCVVLTAVSSKHVQCTEIDVDMEQLMRLNGQSYCSKQHKLFTVNIITIYTNWADGGAV